MAYDLSGTNQWLSTASTPVTAPPLTLACWFNSDSATALQFLVQVEQNASNYFAIAAEGDRAGDPVAIFIRAAGAQARALRTTTGYSANTWHHACGVFATTSSRTVYIDGGNSATDTFPQSVGAATTVKVGAFQSANVAYLDGRIAEVGVWNVALSADEIASLADGMTCDKVRPQSLVFYAPLVRDLIDVKGGLTITNNNTATVAAHPRVYA